MDLQLYCVKECRETSEHVPTLWTGTLNEKEPWAPFWSTETEDKYAGVPWENVAPSGPTFSTLRTWGVVLNMAQKRQSRVLMDWRGRCCVCMGGGVVSPQSRDYTASTISSSFTPNRKRHCSGFTHTARSPSCLTKGRALVSSLAWGIRMIGVGVGSGLQKQKQLRNTVDYRIGS